MPRFTLIWLLLFTGLLTAASIATAADPVLLRLQQASAEPPLLTVYLTVEDAGEQPLPDLALTPSQFSATLGAQRATVTAIEPFAKAGEGIAYLLLVDISRSLREAQFTKLRQALGDWIAALNDRDRAALLTFGDDVRLVQDFTADKAALQAHLAHLQPSDGQTRLYLGLLRALELSRRQDAGLPRRRVIVLLSDGQDDFAGSATLEEVQQTLSDIHTPIFALGLLDPPRTPAKDIALKALGALARRSGGAYRGLGDQSLSVAYADLRRRIEQALVLRLDCPACIADGRPQRLQIELQLGQKRLSAGLDLRLAPPPPPPDPPKTEPVPEPPQPEVKPAVSPPPPEPPPAEPAPESFWERRWLWLAGGSAVGVVLISVIGLWLIRRRRRQPVSPPEPVAVPTTASPVTPTPRPEPPGLRVRLTVIGRSPGAYYDLTVHERIVIGRRSDCDLSLTDDDHLSGTHCALLRIDDRLLVEDLGSTHGTLVNGVPIHGRRALDAGDRLLIGRTDLRISLLGSS